MVSEGSLREGTDLGAFAVDDIGLTAMAILQMMSGVIVWFRPHAKRSIDDVTKSYTAMTMRLVGLQEGAHVSQHA